MNNRIILASKSAARQAMLARAGVMCEIQPSNFDERAAETYLNGVGVSEQAQHLAAGKALEVSARFPEAYVIGADQLLVCDGNILHKAANLEELYEKLQFLRGKTHELHSAVALVRAGQVLWSGVNVAHMTMRNFSDAFLTQYIEQYGQDVLSSVGGYHYEEAGVQLFEQVQGDYYTIVGLPLLLLLKALRQLNILIY